MFNHRYFFLTTKKTELMKKTDMIKCPVTRNDLKKNGYREQYGVIIIYENERHQETIYRKMSAKGLNCRVVVT